MKRAVLITLAVAVPTAAWLIGSLLTQPPTELNPETPLVTRFASPYFVGYHKGERQWSLEAEAVEERPGDGRRIDLIKITEGVLYNDSKPRYRFTADRGEWDQQTNDLRLIGNVRFYENGTLIFATDEVEWSGDEERLRAPARVEVYRDGQTITADRLEAYFKDDRVELIGHVRWTTGEGIEVEAERAVYSDDGLKFVGTSQPVRFVLGGDDASSGKTGNAPPD